MWCSIQGCHALHTKQTWKALLLSMSAFSHLFVTAIRSADSSQGRQADVDVDQILITARTALL